MYDYVFYFALIWNDCIIILEPLQSCTTRTGFMFH